MIYYSSFSPQKKRKQVQALQSKVSEYCRSDIKRTPWDALVSELAGKIILRNVMKLGALCYNH